MTTNEILENIRSNGGFNNFLLWNHKEIAEWVKNNYKCSNYVAQKVALYL